MSILDIITQARAEWRLKRRSSGATTVNLSVDEAFDLLGELKEGHLVPEMAKSADVNYALMNRHLPTLRDVFAGATVFGYKINVVERLS